jgi:hypothetical protein
MPPEALSAPTSMYFVFLTCSRRLLLCFACVLRVSVCVSVVVGVCRSRRSTNRARRRCGHSVRARKPSSETPSPAMTRYAWPIYIYEKRDELISSYTYQSEERYDAKCGLQ